MAEPRQSHLTSGEQRLTKVLQYFAGIRTLPDYPARFGVDHLPGTEKDGRLVGTLVVQLAVERRYGERWPERETTESGYEHGSIVSRRAKVQRPEGGRGF
jgi:hypothetical protein